MPVRKRRSQDGLDHDLTRLSLELTSAATDRRRPRSRGRGCGWPRAARRTHVWSRACSKPSAAPRNGRKRSSRAPAGHAADAGYQQGGRRDTDGQEDGPGDEGAAVAPPPRYSARLSPWPSPAPKVSPLRAKTLRPREPPLLRWFRWRIVPAEAARTDMDETQVSERVTRWIEEGRDLFALLPELLGAAKEAELLRRELMELPQEAGRVEDPERGHAEGARRPPQAGGGATPGERAAPWPRRSRPARRWPRCWRRCRPPNQIAQKLGVTKSPFARREAPAAAPQPAPHE